MTEEKEDLMQAWASNALVHDAQVICTTWKSSETFPLVTKHKKQSFGINVAAYAYTAFTLRSLFPRKRRITISYTIWMEKY